MNRRNFIALSLGLSALGSWLVSCAKKKIRGKIVGSSAAIGHLLREKRSFPVSSSENIKVVIIGGGVSGLSAARQLKLQGKSDFVLLDLESEVGGNALHGQNDISAYPWGAHYIPIPNNDLVDYLDFLKESNVITGIDVKGLPVYNELFLCFDPQERLYINGRWQDSLVPQYGVATEELTQIERFLQLMNEYRYKKDSSGKDAFAIPVDNSSRDPHYLDLDKITMKEWMSDNGFTGEHLHRYVNYCCRDDFGTPHHIVSAWAGIHYFASRKGIGSNAEHGDVLTWPAGNGFLVDELKKSIGTQIRTNSMVLKVKPTESGVRVEYLDTINHSMRVIEAEQCIISVPQFVARRILDDVVNQDLVKKHFHYAPWMVANLVINELEERSGAPLSWDNVMHEGPSLGYVDATHEMLQQQVYRRNITYYLPLTENSPAVEREMAQTRTHGDWVDYVMNDLKKVHPNIRESTDEMNVMLWGHAMVQPRTGLIHGGLREELGKSIADKIHFAHSDLAGVSIFEEAFYQGLAAAKKVIQKFSK